MRHVNLNLVVYYLFGSLAEECLLNCRIFYMVLIDS